MATTTRAEPPRTPDLDEFTHHWQDEADAAFLYRLLADAEPDADEAATSTGGSPRSRTGTSRSGRGCWRSTGAARARIGPTARTRLLAFLGRRFGPGFLLPDAPRRGGARGEGVPRHAPARRARGVAGRDEALLLARGVGGARHHAQRHRGPHAASRGTAPAPAASCATSCTASTTASRRTSASSPACSARRANAQHHAVIVAGVAGLIADALSMGSSGYLAAKSEREVYAHEIAMERDEIALMPEIERDELALIYEAKGMDRESAHRIATQVMADPERMLAEQVQEELGISESATSPLREAWITGLATAVGALIPVLPFFFLDGTHGDRGVVRDRRCSRTGSSARRARCSPDAACSAPASTCSSSGSASRSSATSLGNGSRGCSSRVARHPNSVTTPHEISFPVSRSSRCSSRSRRPSRHRCPDPATGRATASPSVLPAVRRDARHRDSRRPSRRRSRRRLPHRRARGVRRPEPAVRAPRRSDVPALPARSRATAPASDVNVFAVRADDRLPASADAARRDLPHRRHRDLPRHHGGDHRRYHDVERGGGTRPGFNVGTGIGFPLTGFSALAEVRFT